MKKILCLALAGIIVAQLSGCTQGCQKKDKEPSKVLRIGTNATFPPFESIDKQGGLVGFDIDMGRAIAEELGLKPEFKELDFDALILALKKGQIDIALSALSITKSRQAEIEMIPYQGKPMTEIALVFWEKVPENINDLADMKRVAEASKMAVSVQAGHFLEGYLREEKVPLKPLMGPPEQIIDIKYKKTLAAAVDGVNGRTLVSKHPGLKLISLPLPEDKWDLGYGIGLRKTNTELANKVRAAVAKLRENGTISSLEKKWIEDE